MLKSVNFSDIAPYQSAKPMGLPYEISKTLSANFTGVFPGVHRVHR